MLSGWVAKIGWMDYCINTDTMTSHDHNRRAILGGLRRSM